MQKDKEGASLRDSIVVVDYRTSDTQYCLCSRRQTANE